MQNQGDIIVDQWKEAERKEAAKKGMDEAQEANRGNSTKGFCDKVVQNTKEISSEKDKSGLFLVLKTFKLFQARAEKQWKARKGYV